MKMGHAIAGAAPGPTCRECDGDGRSVSPRPSGPRPGRAVVGPASRVPGSRTGVCFGQHHAPTARSWTDGELVRYDASWACQRVICSAARSAGRHPRWAYYCNAGSGALAFGRQLLRGTRRTSAPLVFFVRDAPRARNRQRWRLAARTNQAAWASRSRRGRDRRVGVGVGLIITTHGDVPPVARHHKQKSRHYTQQLAGVTSPIEPT